ncbi:MAG: hypothetical protein K8S54_10725 [Spirochaetia bacterium]|nr:hypothetical protein [Spirochaetia bacterium]
MNTRIPIALVAAFCLTGPLQAQAMPQGHQLSGLVGGGFQYSERRSDSQTLRSYTMPIFLPLEATLGRLYLTGSLEYARNEAIGLSEGRSEGLNYVNMEGRFRAIDSRRFRLSFTEVAGVSTAHKEESSLASLQSGYRVDTGVTLAYRRDQLNMELLAQHTWNKARGDYRQGDVMSGGFMLGWGMGDYSGETWPVNLMMGVTSRVYQADRFRGEEMPGTDYGTVFFSPGLMLSGRSVSLHAGLDFPIKHLGQEDRGYRDRMRANIGLKYFLQ